MSNPSKTQEKCAQCGWLKENHRNGYCYHYSDEDTDYFYNDRKFISEKELEGKKYNRAFNGKIIIEELRDGILNVLQKWNKPSGQFTAFWYGYEVLMDDLKEDGHDRKLREIKKEIKDLQINGTVEMKPVYDEEGKINGRGWFLCKPKVKQ